MEPIVLLFMIQPVIAEFRYGPSNEAVVAGKDVVMKCGYNGNLSRQWKFKEINGEEITLSYESRISSDNSYSITLNSSMLEQYDLNISSANRNNAGVYSCLLEEESLVNNNSKNTPQTKRYEAYLAILFSDPSCDVNVSIAKHTMKENDIMEAQCSVTYYSIKDNLRMEWRRNDGSVVNAITHESSSTQGTHKVSSSYRFKATAEDNGLKLICFTYFTQSNESISSDPHVHRATNAPDYSHVCIIPPLYVQYKPRNVIILQQNEDISKPTGCYNCFAEGNPKPECKWRIITTTNETISHLGCVLRIGEYVSSDSEITVECRVINNIGEDMTTMKINVTVNGDGSASSESNFSYQFLVIAALVLVGFLIIITVIISQRRIEVNRMKNSEINKELPFKHNRIQTLSQINTNQLEHQNCDAFYSSVGAIENNNEIYSEVKVLDDNIADQVIYCEIPSAAETEKCRSYSQSNYLGAIYEEVKNHDNGLQENSTKHQTVGADGTVYTEVNMSKGEKMKTDSVKPKCENSTYTKIDHDCKIPPPPPKSNFE